MDTILTATEKCKILQFRVNYLIEYLETDPAIRNSTEIEERINAVQDLLDDIKNHYGY